MHHFSYLLGAAVVALATPAAAQMAGAEPAVPGEARADARALDRSPVLGDAETDPTAFAKKAALSNMLEIRTSEIAAAKGQSEKVKTFAQKMIEDHGKASEKLTTLARAQSIALPLALDVAHQAKVDDIADETGEEFDKDYLDLQEEAHEEAVNLFRGFAEDGPNGPLKQFAAQTLPTLEQHLAEVRTLREGFDWGDDALGLDQAENDEILDARDPQ